MQRTLVWLSAVAMLASSPARAARAQTTEQDSEMVGVTTRVALLRQYNGALHLGVVFHNTTARVVRNGSALPFDTLSIVDAKTGRKSFALRDAGGHFLAGPISDWNDGGRWFPNIAANGEVLVWAVFEPVAAATVDLNVPLSQPFDGVPVTTAPPAPVTDVGAGLGHVRAALTAASRADGQLKVRITLTNPGPDTAGGSALQYADAYVLDPASQKKYALVKDADGNYLAQPISDKNGGGRLFLSTIRPGGRTFMTLTFTAPPDSVQAVDVVLPWIDPFENVALAGTGGATDTGTAVAGATSSSASGQPKPGSALVVCLAEAADDSAVYPTSVFPAGATTEVTAVIRLAPGESYPSMTATWIAVAVSGTPPNFVITKTALDLKGKDRAAVHLTHPDGLLAGTYRLELTAGGRPWKSAAFSVAPIPSPDVKQAADLLPLKPGTVWSYTFAQAFGPNVRPRLPPGVKLDPDGRFRVRMTKTAAGVDEAGTHVESRRNNELIEDEWWRLTDAGLVITKIRSGGNESVFSPPHPIWPWPFKTPREWSFEPADKSYTQRWRMWGPVPIKGPGGEAPGYVVLMEQPSPQIDVSAERDYIPGIGMVREIITQARNGVLVTGWENELTAKP